VTGRVIKQTIRRREFLGEGLEKPGKFQNRENSKTRWGPEIDKKT